LLFLNAGVLEQVFHLKQTSDMSKLGEAGPFAALVVAIGFMSLLLPPFGAFIGKWFSLETLGAVAPEFKIAGAAVLVCIAGGGAVLSLLYFKVLGAMISRTGETDKVKFEHLNPLYKNTLRFLLFLLLDCTFFLPYLLSNYFSPIASNVLQTNLIPVVVSGMSLWIDSMQLSLIPLLATFILLPLGIVVALLVRFKKVDRVKEYACGEKVEYNFSSFYFSTEKAVPYFATVGTAFFVVILLVAFFM
jgi:ech hydrogenase subunit A